MLVVPRWCFGLYRASSGGGVAEAGGSGLRALPKLVAGIVLSLAKVFTDTFVGGDGGGALVVPFSLLGAPL